MHVYIKINDAKGQLQVDTDNDITIIDTNTWKKIYIKADIVLYTKGEACFQFRENAIPVHICCNKTC